jgi:hypothetical protein
MKEIHVRVILCLSLMCVKLKTQLIVILHVKNVGHLHYIATLVLREFYSLVLEIVNNIVIKDIIILIKYVINAILSVNHVLL